MQAHLSGSTAMIGGVALLAASLVPPTAAGAHPAPTREGTTTCTGSQTVTYAPGVADRDRTVSLHGTSTLSRCASSADPTITAARSTFTARGRLSCTSGDYSGTRKIDWNNGRTSTLSFHSIVSAHDRQSLVAIKGEVTGGEFNGQRWSGAFTMFNERPSACRAPFGVPTTVGLMVLTVGSLVPGRSALENSRPSLH